MAGGEALKADFEPKAKVADVISLGADRPALSVVQGIQLDRSRDALLTVFG